MTANIRESNEIWIGIDGGGSNTRVIAAGSDGTVRAYGTVRAAASQYKDSRAKANVHGAIREALTAAGCAPSAVRGLAAGVAGYDDPADLAWVEPLTDVEGLSCPRWHVNDAVVAHYGALVAQPGIVAVAGTGSILFGITEDGSRLRNYDFHHYAASAARFLAYDAVYEALAGFTDATDTGVVTAMLAHWQVRSLAELGALGRTGFHPDVRERNRIFGEFAPVLTEAALNGSTLARTVCDRTIHQTTVGLRLLAGQFAGDSITVACIGSVINSPYFQRELGMRLAAPSSRSFRLIEPVFPPAVGAVLYAMEQAGMPADRRVIDRLAASLAEFGQPAD